VSLVLIGVAWQLPVLLIASAVLLVAEWPLGRLVHARHAEGHPAVRQTVPDPGPAAAGGYR